MLGRRWIKNPNSNGKDLPEADEKGQMRGRTDDVNST